MEANGERISREKSRRKMIALVVHQFIVQIQSNISSNWSNDYYRNIFTFFAKHGCEGDLQTCRICWWNVAAIDVRNEI